MCVGGWVRGQRTVCNIQFFPSALWVLRGQTWFSGLVAGIFTGRAILLAQAAVLHLDLFRGWWIWQLAFFKVSNPTEKGV